MVVQAREVGVATSTLAPSLSRQCRTAETISTVATVECAQPAAVEFTATMTLIKSGIVVLLVSSREKCSILLIYNTISPS